jgi:hypothetical protein
VNVGPALDKHDCKREMALFDSHRQCRVSSPVFGVYVGPTLDKDIRNIKEAVFDRLDQCYC